MLVGGEGISPGSSAVHAVPDAMADAGRTMLNIVNESTQLEESNWKCKDCGHRPETVFRRERDVVK